MVENSGTVQQEENSRKGRINALVAIIFLQAVALWAATAWYLFELFTARPDSMGSAVFLFALIVLAALWVSATAIGIVRRSSWARGSAVTIQILQLAIALGSFQGEFAQPLVGWILLLSAGSALTMLILSTKRQVDSEKSETAG